MTRVLFIFAGPTPWDDEDRLVGGHSLPMIPEAELTIKGILDAAPQPIAAVYCAKANEACEQAAKMVAGRFNLRVRDNAALDEIHLGLWEGLTRSDLRFRFPTIFPQWEEKPILVKPPDGESLEEAILRIGGALKKIVRRNRGYSIAIVLRPYALQISLGLLRGESAEGIGSHLQAITSAETIEIQD